MGNNTTDQAHAASEPWKVERRVGEVLLKLLDGIERDISDGKLSHLEAYETLCRAEAARTGS